ncbi:tetratricopeptide repeat protein [Vibrio taketomensis]|uniref:tetratricopeptide repeat protein n=1 Tax=Vibrio taketomensis TaxID=2572923 RepID=UPI001389C650|nr:hypothetical protein [Vibrio taketomensis]
MRKFINSMSSALVLATMLQGCVSPSNGNVDRSDQLNLETQERVLLASNNTVGLIEFYQNQLKDAESEHYRIKLAEVYLKKHDPESALFVLTPLTGKSPSSAESTLVAAKAHMDLGQFEVALGMLENAYEQSPLMVRSRIYWVLFMQKQVNLNKPEQCLTWRELIFIAT